MQLKTDIALSAAGSTAYQSRFKSWMAPFKGVASKYMKSYLGWRRMIEREGSQLTPRHLIAQAMGG